MDLTDNWEVYIWSDFVQARDEREIERREGEMVDYLWNTEIRDNYE